MNLLHLRYFQIVAQTENITKAADILYISQPSLSKTIRQLENELGYDLFDRKGRSILLNSYGKIFLSYVNESFSLLKQGEEALNELATGITNHLALYTPVGSPVLPDMLKVLKKSHPEIHFQLIQHHNIKDQKIHYDFAITTTPQEKDYIVPLLTEELRLAVPQSHPLASRSIITLKDLEGASFIGLAKYKPLRKTIDTYLELHDIHVNYVFESDDPATVRGLIEAGLGIGYIPSILWKKLHTDCLNFLKIADEPLQRTIYLCWPKELSLNSAHRMMIAEVQEFYQKLTE